MIKPVKTHIIASVAMMGLQIFGGWLSDVIGRLKAIAIGSVMGMFGFVAIYLAPNLEWMTVALILMMVPGRVSNSPHEELPCSSVHASDNRQLRVYCLHAIDTR